MKAKETKNKPSPFTTITAISSRRPLTYQQLVDEGAPYEAFLVNRAFSLTEDTVLAANMMNQRSWLDKEIQAEFFIHALRPRRRFEKWPKTLQDEATDIVAKYYGMSRREARIHVSIHKEEEISAMKNVLETGALPSRVR